jgi:hypothetical protein
MVARASRTTAATALLAGLCFSQPSFHSGTDLVIVPFQVSRGSRSVSDLKPSDVVLLEDGVPRGFTVFEAPPAHLTLDLAVMFDVTNPKAGQKGPAGFWDAQALQELAGYWSESISRRLLDERGVTIRFSIYRFDQTKLQRLCQSTSDPRVLSDALHRLAGPATGQDVDIPLPAGLAVRNMERQWQAEGNLPQPWSLAGAFSVLRDSAVSALPAEEKAHPEKAGRALVIFSTGAEGTSLTPEDLANQAAAAGVPIYPVALPDFPWVLPYEGFTYRGPVRGGFYAFGGLNDDAGGGNKPSMFGPGGAYYCSKCGNYIASYINYPFELLGNLTGGLNFEAVNHFVIPPDADAQGFVLTPSPGAVSMTGGETDDIMERVKKHALARFSSSYTVGFVPSPSGAPREHKLEVKLAPKSSGKVTEGKRIAAY